MRRKKLWHGPMTVTKRANGKAAVDGPKRDIKLLVAHAKLFALNWRKDAGDANGAFAINAAFYKDHGEKYADIQSFLEMTPAPATMQIEFAL